MPRHSPFALSSLTIKLVHEQISIVAVVHTLVRTSRNDQPLVKQSYALLVYDLFATCRFSTMYSVVKDQDLEF